MILKQGKQSDKPVFSLGTHETPVQANIREKERKTAITDER